MTELVVLMCSVGIAGAIFAVESARGRVRGQVDFLRAASGVYLLCFAIAPAYLQFADPALFRAGQWSWILRTPFQDNAFAYASVLALIGYPFMLGGYWLAMRSYRAPTDDTPPVSRSYLWFAGVSIGLVGMTALLIYVRAVGGWVVFFVEAIALRSNSSVEGTAWAFLANVAPLVIGAMLLFYALRQYEGRGGWRSAATLLCVGFYLASLALLFNQAGRAWFVAFLITVPLIRAVQRDRLRLTQVLLGGMLFALLIVFGRTFFQLLRDPTRLFEASRGEEGIAGAARAIIWEFTFPVATLANVIRSIPEHGGLRWFYDVPLAFVYLVPQRLTGVMHEPTVSMVNTAMFGADGGIPVDVLSLGYYSLLVPGVLLTAAGLGALLGLGERCFPASTDPVRAALRVSWILTLAFRVMYADPQLFWRAGLYLVITTLLVAAPGVLSRLLFLAEDRRSRVLQASGSQP